MPLKHFQNIKSAPNRGKPKYLNIHRTRHGSVIYFVRKGKGDRVRLPNDYGSPDFWVAYAKAVAAVEAAAPAPRLVKAEKPIVQRVEKALVKCLAGAKVRARQRGLPFEIDIDWALKTARKQDFKCQLTGIPFFSELKDRKFSRSPLAPSIDRIDSSIGYTKENCRITNVAINTMLLDWGQELFERVANCYRNNKRQTRLPTPEAGQ